MSFPSSTLSLRTRAALVAAALVLGCTGAARAADDTPHFSEATSAAFAKLKPLQDQNKWDEMIAVLDAIPGVVPGSYDQANILDMKAKLNLRREQFAKAIEPWEQAIKINDQHHYFDAKQTQDMYYYLARLCAQEAMSNKSAPGSQAAMFDKAITYFKRWFELSKKPTADDIVTYASVLYYKAVSDPKNIDQAALREARSQINKGLLMAVHPKESFYMLLLSIMQQENDIPGSSELLELILANNPSKKDLWPALMATYLNLANDNAKDEEKSRQFYIRAIYTIERAQKLGLLKTPKDNMNLVSLYLAVGQLRRATDTLYDGLKSGGIDNDPKNWINLGLIYQQDADNLSAIRVLQEAAQRFPKNGQIELQIGEIYRSDEHTRDAYKHYKEALRKGGVDKPHVLHQLIAYSAFELQEFDEALKAIAEAQKFPENKNDQQLPRLKAAIEDSLKEREFNAEAAKKKQQQL